MTRPDWLRAAAFTLLGLAVALPASAQDEKARGKGKAEKTRKVEVEGVSFEVPEGWASKKPSTAMQKEVIEVPAADGDSEPARLVLYVFPGGAGTVEANVERWQNQFKDEDGQAAEAETAKVEGDGVEVTRVEVAGTYKDPFAPGGPNEDYRLLGAILTTDTAGYFFKMVGPDKTMKGAEAGFDAMIKSLKLGK
jgi:hypothetical protein